MIDPTHMLKARPIEEIAVNFMAAVDDLLDCPELSRAVLREATVRRIAEVLGQKLALQARIMIGEEDCDE